ncbi:gamma carbonic anhydrase family protein [Streptomyces candidus]|uniref:Carbonic anhydrase/acetyltransferase-like protein (Isoleucine patch superfamily) n=1 Tax=Streptomyces candidus TaxID=67283 RepID=A0A7X0HEA1_9ACTN|nr:acyltransferase [Streptomyces candidus]MBB6436040.1 carbonic anhydrase/acetyltransferase-like protein (isoleucine patch superfamily) [Streptomyces candidus]GHH43440.1 hypothetical protein GCM10018773_29450 [Streptomyces candidus]
MSEEAQGIRIRHRGHAPQVHPTAYVAPTATLVGDVRVGPRARVMYGAVLDAEGSRIEVGEAAVICENAVLRGSAVAGDQPVLVGDHVFVGPHATLLGCEVDRCVYVATGATVLQRARLGAGSVVAVGALVHARTVVPEEYFVPPCTVALDAPVRLLAPDDPGLAQAVGRVGFAQVAFSVDAEWTDRISRNEHIAEVRAAEFGTHADDEVLGFGWRSSNAPCTPREDSDRIDDAGEAHDDSVTVDDPRVAQGAVERHASEGSAQDSPADAHMKGRP